MAEGVDALTFPMPRESESASRVRAIVSDMLTLFSDDNSDGVLSEYITVLLCNGKSQSQASKDLEAFLGDKSWEFVACLWELLLKDFMQAKQENSASEPNTAVDFGSHDTLIKQGHDDYDHKATNATTCVKDVEAHVSPKAKNMKMLRQELINSPCSRKAQPKAKDDWKQSGVNYSRKILRSIVVSANKQPCGMNPDKYEKFVDERSGILQKHPYFPERKMEQCYYQSVPSGAAVPARFHDAASHQEMRHRVSVWDRLSRPSSNRVLNMKCPPFPEFGIQAHENKVLQQHSTTFPAAYSEQQSETFQREVPAVGYMHRVFQSHKTIKPMSGTITATEPRTAYNLSRKRRYGIISPSSGDSLAGEFSSVLQYKEAKQDVKKPSLLSNQSTNPDLFTEILNVKQKMQQLEIQLNQAKQFKKQKIGELNCSPQFDKLQHQKNLTESRIIHVTNVHYAAKKEAIAMFFSKCGAVKNVTIVTDPVTRHPKGAAFVTFATKESVNKAIAMSNTMFYSRPIKVWRQVLP